MSESAEVRAVVEAARETAVLFDGTALRGRIDVAGEDRVRWLDGMISGDVEALESSAPGAGCYATLLTNRGAIVADLHVGRFEDHFVLESTRSEIPRILEALDRFIIADDVTLTDRSATDVTWGLEGRQARARLAAALDGDAAPPEDECWTRGRIGGTEVLIGAFGWSGEPAFQIRVDATGGATGAAAVAAALDAAGDGTPLLRGTAEALEILRVEAGIPALGAELDEEVLPPEARLEHAIATDKGCYVGQEIVARLRARGQVNHLLVGLALSPASGEPPVVDTELEVDGRRTGELTSVVASPRFGPIALGYVRREHAEPGTRVSFDGGHGEVVALPFAGADQVRGA